MAVSLVVASAMPAGASPVSVPGSDNQGSALALGPDHHRRPSLRAQASSAAAAPREGQHEPASDAGLIVSAGRWWSESEEWLKWLHGQWSVVHEWATYRLRTRPGAALSFWMSNGLNQFFGLFSHDGNGPMMSIASFGALSVEPVTGAESSGYGYRVHPIMNRRRFHKGVDYKADRGTPVHAAGPGVVTVARRRGSYGKLVIISHGLGLETRYAHLGQIDVEEGQFVPGGTLIGQVGSTGRTTGPHLHFEVRQFGQAVDPVLAMTRPEQGGPGDSRSMLGWRTLGWLSHSFQ